MAFNTVTRTALNSYIVYKQNYHSPRKLKEKLPYMIDIIKQLGAEWFTVKDIADEDTLRPTRSRKTSREDSHSAVSAALKSNERDLQPSAANVTGTHMEFPEA